MKTNKNKTIYLTGGWGYGNLGDNAILHAMLDTFSQRLEGYELIITSNSIEEIQRHHNRSAILSIHHLMSLRKPLSLFRWLAVYIWRLSNHKLMLSNSLRTHIQLINESSAVVLGGGGYLNDQWSDMLLARYLEIEIAHIHKIPIMIYGQTIGPFSDTTIAKTLTTNLNKINYIAYRDIQSLDTLNRAHYSILNSIHSADEANLLPVSLKNKFSSNNGITNVGVMIQKFRPHLSPLGPSKRGHIKNEHEYVNTIVAGLVDSFLKANKVKFIFIPSTSWDEKICKLIYRKLSEKVGSSNTVYLGLLPISEFIESCQSVDIMISTNMHPVIIAATNNRPSIALSYHYKLDDYMKSIGLDENILKIDDLDSTALANILNKSIQRITELSQTISIKKENVLNQAKENANALCKLLIK